jgi:hypothetical protein
VNKESQQNKQQWTPDRVKSFWDAFHGFDYTAMQEKFGAPDPAGPDYTQWFNDAARDALASEIQNARENRILRENDEHGLYELGLDIDGHVVNAIEDMARHIKALVQPKLNLQ